jgi:hypothetical protein
MFENQNRIIIVDDIQTELDQLGKSFFVNGLGCRTFLYEQAYNQPLQNVRIAFFDINLTHGNPIIETEVDKILENHSKEFNDLANAINQYIHIDNGPFALIFWTKNSQVVEAFKIFMQNPERGFNDSTAKPIYIGHIDKVNLNEENTNLAERVITLLNSDEKIKFLFDLEENARIAGEKSINRIYNILPKDTLWGENTILFENMDKVLSKIASSTLGFSHAKENPKKAIYEGLLPILNYELINCNSDVKWNNIVNQLHKAQKNGDIVSPDDSIQHKVNTLYHIEDFFNQTKDVRGSLIEINKNSVGILKSLNIENIEDWMSKLLAIKESNPQQQARKLDIINNSKLIAIELSAACDFSNKKSRINKYMLGVLTSNLSSNLESDLNLKSRPEACYHLGGCCFYHNNNNYHIWLNLNYVFGAKPDDERFSDTIFILKKEIMDMLGNKYASHISRIGITSF